MVEWDDGVGNEGDGFFGVGIFGGGDDVRRFHTDIEGDHAHSADVAATASSQASTGSVIPYVQLLTCVKD